MLLESLVNATVELQGFRIVTVTGDTGGLVAELAPNRRCAPRCGQCGERGGYRDTRRVRRFRQVPLWGIAVARRVRCPRCAGVHVESLPVGSSNPTVLSPTLFGVAVPFLDR